MVLSQGENEMKNNSPHEVFFTFNSFPARGRWLLSINIEMILVASHDEQVSHLSGPGILGFGGVYCDIGDPIVLDFPLDIWY